MKIFKGILFLINTLRRIPKFDRGWDFHFNPTHPDETTRQMKSKLKSQKKNPEQVFKFPHTPTQPAIVSTLPVFRRAPWKRPACVSIGKSLHLSIFQKTAKGYWHTRPFCARQPSTPSGNIPCPDEPQNEPPPSDRVPFVAPENAYSWRLKWEFMVRQMLPGMVGG